MLAILAVGGARRAQRIRQIRVTTVHRLRRGWRRLRLACGLIGRLIGSMGLVRCASRPIGPAALPIVLPIALVRVLAVVLPMIPAIVLCAVVALPGIRRLRGLR